MKNKLVVVFMISMLVLNFIAWNYITINNEKQITRITEVLEKCNIDG